MEKLKTLQAEAQADRKSAREYLSRVEEIAGRSDDKIMVGRANDGSVLLTFFLSSFLSFIFFLFYLLFSFSSFPFRSWCQCPSLYPSSALLTITI